MKTSPASSDTSPETATGEEEVWRLRLRQAAAMINLSLRRYMYSRVFWILTTLCFIPLAISAIVFLFHIVQPGAAEAQGSAANYRRIVEPLYQGALIHLGVIFAAVAFGTSAIREEFDERTFHLFALQPMPRWLFVMSKYVAFLVLGSAFFISTLIGLRLLVAVAPGSVGLGYLFSGSAMLHLLCEIAVLVIALAVYSALFLTLGTLLKNAIFALFVYAWELSTNLMPETLRNFSIAYHLKGMLVHQTSVRPGFIGVLEAGPGPIQITLVLVGILAVSLTAGCLLATWRQCVYGSS